jgi:hypothetical protein
MKIKGFFKSVFKVFGRKGKVVMHCLMDNHFHFVIQIRCGKEVTKVFLIFNSYAKSFNKQQDRTGSLFEKHFKG